ncbi:MAG TPA: hypothetical protein VHP33_16015 [Polyangiaceae bacterium]|nr:hypothetical protein [Polyangiaceae bacterium]
MVLLSAATGWAQVPSAPPRPAPQRPVPPAAEPLPPQPPPPPAAEPAPVPPKPPAPAPAAPAPTPAAPPPPPAPAVEPPLDLPKSEPRRPAFLKTREEMERIKPSRERREAPALAEPAAPAPQAVPKDFLLNASPWVDFTLTSFYMENRVGNFLNLGVQFGGYLWERLRVSGRLVVPLEDVNDDVSNYSYGSSSSGDGAFRRVDARSMSALYGASVGLLITNSKSFVFGPSIELQRTDVSAYGTAVAFGLPFEWTTQKNLRIGFELAIGHAFGGSSQQVCRTFSTPTTSCGERKVDRESGMTVLFQYNMGWALGTF